MAKTKKPAPIACKPIIDGNVFVVEYDKGQRSSFITADYFERDEDTVIFFDEEDAVIVAVIKGWIQVRRIDAREVAMLQDKIDCDQDEYLDRMRSVYRPPIEV